MKKSNNKLIYKIRDYINHFEVKEEGINNIGTYFLPKIIKIRKNLYALVFAIMKMLPAKQIINEALKRGDIREDMTIIATSSGTFALGVAINCFMLGVPFKIFGDPAIDDHLYQVLAGLGGKVHICRDSKVQGAYQNLRLKALNNYINENKMSYWLRQYDNLDNTKSYYIVGEYIQNYFNRKINIVGSVGSGGSTCGIIKKFREKYSDAQLIGVDTFNSVLFGLPNGPRLLRGLGNTIIPKNLDHKLFDQIHWVSANDAYFYTRELYNNNDLFCGPTTGAAYQAADYLAKRNPEETYIFTAPDGGFRYVNTVYNDEWLMKQNFYSKIITPFPSEVISPSEVKAPWSYLKWNRANYTDIVGGINEFK